MITEDTFTGEYCYALDAKGRVNIPAKFRSALSPENDGTFVITQGLDPCVVAYPLLEWQKVEAGLRSLSSASGFNRSFIRDTVRHATWAKMDKQGRIPITPSLQEFGNLEKDVLIVGVVNKIELWNPERLAQLDESSLSTDSERYEELAGKIII